MNCFSQACFNFSFGWVSELGFLKIACASSLHRSIQKGCIRCNRWSSFPPASTQSSYLGLMYSEMTLFGTSSTSPDIGFRTIGIGFESAMLIVWSFWKSPSLISPLLTGVKGPPLSPCFLFLFECTRSVGWCPGRSRIGLQTL